MSSERRVRVSAGTAVVLGLSSARVDARPTTAYLMTGVEDGCLYDCAFCARARSAKGRSDALSRVTWPEWPEDEVFARLVRAHDDEVLKRACFQVVRTKDYIDDICRRVRLLASYGELSVCVSANLRSSAEVARLLEVGVDRVSIPIDAASPAVYARVKGGSWHGTLELLRECARKFPGRITTHIIIGLGESEEDAVSLIGSLTDEGIMTALFAFTPVRGTRLEGAKPPDITSYRKIQAARYLLDRGLVRVSQMTFVDGVLTDFGLDRATLLEVLADGEAFRTSGCPDCNRPYYNERPGGVIYNYPEPLTEAQREEALAQLAGGLSR